MKQPGLLFALGAAVTWGLVYTFDQRILDKLSPIGLLFVDSALSIMIAVPVLLLRPKEFEGVLIGAHAHLGLIVGSLVLATVANYCIYSGIRLLGASTASVFEITYPFFVVLFGMMFFHRPTNAFFIVGGILIFAGVFLILRFG